MAEGPIRNLRHSFLLTAKDVFSILLFKAPVHQREREGKLTMIRVKRVYDAPDNNDGLRILVDRLWPRGFSTASAAVDLWLKDLAPSDALRKWFGHDPERWLQFRKQYYRELGKYAEPLKHIGAHGRESDLTLLYAASDTDRNNAVALRDYLRRMHRIPTPFA
jgi:uncharacterized protein YeaO (DUF488 family)